MATQKLHGQTILQLANRAKGVAKMIDAGQMDAAHYYFSGLTFKLSPARVAQVSDHLTAIETAFKANDSQAIEAEADKLLGLIL